MKKINKLINIINNSESEKQFDKYTIEQLSLWVDLNRNIISDQYQEELLKILNKILIQAYITEREKNDIISIIKNYVELYKDEIIQLYKLRDFIKKFKNNQNTREDSQKLVAILDYPFFNDDQMGSEIYKELTNIAIGYDVNRSVELSEKLITDKINELQLENKLRYLKQRVKNKENIGIDLIEILDNNFAIQQIHEMAEKQLQLALASYSQFMKDKEIVFISLTLIALLEYDSNYYDGVRKTYPELYQKYSEQKIEGFIRSFLTKYTKRKDSKHRTRIINILLANAIVPKHYLLEFIDFIYDIYELNLEYTIPKNCYEEFEFVYEGIKNSLLLTNDSFELEVTQKTYKLIKTTKDLIVHDPEPIIRLSIAIAKLIDQEVNGKEEVVIYNPYLRDSFNKWREKRKEVLPESFIRGRWEPELHLYEDKVYLISPIHKISAVHNYADIRIEVLNGEKIISQIAPSDIRGIVGGYRIEVPNIILKKPLNKVRYRVLVKDEVLYDSCRKLYRNYIVFNENGEELQNNKDYKGNALVCHTGEIPNFKRVYQTGFYKISHKLVKFSDVIKFDKNLFSFSALCIPGVFGEQYEDCSISYAEKDNIIPVFKKTDFLMFECPSNIRPEYLIINGEKNYLHNMKCTITERDGKKKYVINLQIKEPGVYKINIPKVDTFDLMYDPALQVKKVKYSDKKGYVRVKSGLNDKIIKQEIIVPEFDGLKLFFYYKGKKYKYNIDLNFDIYRIDDGKWHVFEDNIWINDIKNDSYLYIYGKTFNSVMIYSDTGEELESELNLKSEDDYNKIAIGSFLSYKTFYNFVDIVLITKKGQYKKIRCYNKCVIDEEKIEFDFDSNRRTILLIAAYHGKGKVFFEVTNTIDEVIYKSEFISNDEIFEIPINETFTDYSITFFEQEKWGLISKNKKMKSFSKKVYAFDDLINREFKIKEVFYNKMIKGKFVEKVRYLNKSYIQFTEKISDKIYVGNLYNQTATRKFWLYKINPIKIEICSDILDEELDIYMTKDGDGLLLDYKYNSILNNVTDPNLPDITYYTISISEEGDSWKN